MMQLKKRDEEPGKGYKVEAVEMVYIKVVVMAFAMIIMLAGMPLSVQAQTETGLVGEWHFDGDAKDSSGNGNDGIIYGATFVDGKVGKALSFNGGNDYVTGSSSNFPLGDTPRTIEAWIQTTTYSSDQIIFLQGSTSACLEKMFHLATGGGKAGIGNGCGAGMVFGEKSVSDGQWHHIAGTYEGAGIVKIYVDGIFNGSATIPVPNTLSGFKIGISAWGDVKFHGLIDEVRIYNRALSADEIKAHYEGKQTSLTLIKTASPYSIKQGQTTTVTVTIKNTGTTDIANIEVMDSIHRNFDLISGDFPNPKKFDIIGKGESREIQYMIKSKEAGTFNLDPATGIYTDKDGNIQEVKSEPFSVKVIPSSEGISGTPSGQLSKLSASVSLTGEKTDVVLGEDILLKFSAVNLITKPKMHMQVIIIPPSGMSVTSSEFSKSGTNQFTANYELEPGDGKDIGVGIKPNQIGDFNVNGRIVYYFGDEKDKAEDYTLNLPVKVRKEIASTPAQSSIENPVQKSIPGFGVIIGINGILFAIISKRRR